ncbi:polyphosphate kinase 1 [Novipirellula artificiosorum]|uniref:Polyphosphate kinase n=1 Tax=Novipirellula artificiosorum TaxID=2528016 RepID=A0A5C6E129_9BACT|nr:polyphosphate kinase 1 [Novipirellula artificiosorum]TWU42174.1 Polyphosphate kinase [Novipirellula artificiosorum]
MPKKSSATKKKTRSIDLPLPEDRFINRELGWLAFNERVLDQAADASLPLLERAKFLAITGSNLDEFVMVRIGGLKLQFDRNAMVRDAAGLTVSQQVNAVSSCCKDLVQRQYAILRDVLEPQLAEADVCRVKLDDCSDRIREVAQRRFESDVSAVLSPQTITHDRPFPLLQGLGVHLCVRLRAEPKPVKRLNDQDFERFGVEDAAAAVAEADPWQYAVIPLGRTVPRLIPVPMDRGHGYILLEDLVSYFVDDFFPGREVMECVAFRITRNADIELQEDGAADLVDGMEEILESRRLSRVIRLEYHAEASDSVVAFLSEMMQLTNLDLYPIDGPMDLSYLFTLHGLEGYDSLRDQPWLPQANPDIDPADPMFSTIAKGDLLLVHPYERFDPVVRLIEEAVADPDVLAIKQVLYRTSKRSPIVAALMRAAERGKYVSVIVELKARFDEARNIEWAREMEQAGVQVIYGIRGLKTHAKVCIIVRREPQGIVRYMHFGTGNYNEATAKIYSDVSILTCNDTLGADATTFFNAVTGASQPQQLQLLAAAPMTLRKRILNLIEAETRRCLEGQKAEIVAKLNALVDTQVIDALYRASQAGVRIRLNIRGVCCLRPGVKGLSETIEVISIVDRFLEHARIIYFRHGGDDDLFISSADWMPRNLDRRVELLVPVIDQRCREKLLSTLRTYFRDNTNCWRMLPTGQYKRGKPEGKEKASFQSQRVLYDRAVEAVRKLKQSRRTTFETHQPKEASGT